MKFYSTLLLSIISISLFAQTDSIKPTLDSTVVDAKTAQKELVKHLKEARVLSAVNQTPDFTKARKEIDEAMNNSQFSENMADVYYEAGNVEYNFYEIERNKPANGKAIDYDTLYAATLKSFNYFVDAYNLYFYSDQKKKANQTLKLNMQKKAWTLFNVTDGFRAYAAYAFEHKDWATSHKCFDMFVKTLEEKIVNDYAASNSRVKKTLSQYQNDSVVAHAKYFRAISAINMNDLQLAIANLEEIKYDGFEQNVVLQELCHLYREVGEDKKFEDLLLEGTKLLPNEPWYARNLVNIYLDRKDYKVASDMIDQLIMVDSNNPDNLSLKGQLVEHLGDPDAALEYYKRSYEIDANNSEINSHIGRIWYNRANKIEGDYFSQRQYVEADTESLPIYLKSLEYYERAFELEEPHRDETIAKAIRTILYKQFTKVDCPNKNELIEQYNNVSRAYGMKEFPR